MSSSLIVEVCDIKEIKEHSNADLLEIAVIKGWNCIVKKGEYKVGDVVIYIPPDAILPQPLIEKLNVANYLKGKNKDRVGVAKLRGEMSYGLIIPNEKNWDVGYNCTEDLGIIKYEPPVKTTIGDAAPEDPMFHRYTDIENINNFPNLFKDGEEVVVTEKIDGCFREDQKVMMANGEQIPISKIEEGDMVLSYDENNDVFIPQKVENVISRELDKEWIELSFDNGDKTICTNDHLFLTDRGWIKAQNLNEEDEFIRMGDSNV